MRWLFLFLFSVSFSSILAQTAEALYNEGLELKKNKKSAEAAEKFKKAVQLKPDYTEARYEWAWCQNDLKVYTGAIENLRIVRAVWSNYVKVHFELGYAFEKSNMYDSAIATYNRCLQLKPDYYSVYKQLGHIAYLRDDNKTALENYSKVPATSTAANDYLLWYRKGFIENAAKKYDSARQSLQQSLKYKTDYINTYLELGFASKNLKQDDDAIMYYEKALAVDPKSHIPYNGIGEVYRDNKKDYDKSMEWYGKTLAINDKERKANFGMGYCLNSKGKYSEAIPYLKKAIENEKDYIAAHVELGFSQYKTNNFTDALANLTKAMQLNPANENSRYYATLVYIAQKNKTMAQKMVDELKGLSSKYVKELQDKVNAM